MHHKLASLFSALNEAGIEWTLLRVPRNPEFPPGDVDLLVRSEDLTAFQTVARSAGFVGLPGWQEWPSLVYIAFDRAAARFLVLDVTDRIAFGRRGELPTDLARGVLQRRVWDGEVATPSPDDAFWLLLLHCVLDKGAVPEHYRERLLAGAVDAGIGGPFARLLDALPGRRADSGAESLRIAAVSGNWDGLTAAAEPLREAMQDALSVRQRASVRVEQARRAFRRPALLAQRRGLSIALLGTNGAGKSTLSEGIRRTFPLPVTGVYMGLWKNADNNPSRRRQLVDVVLRPFRAWAKFLRARTLQARGDLVVFDRYVYDARRPPAPPAVLAKRIYFWLLSRACGAPDLTVLLDLPGAVAFGRKGEDGINETEIERQEFLALGEELELHVVDATRSADEVRGEVLALIWDAYRARWGQPPVGTVGLRPSAPDAASVAS